jgi:hypothetical protein
MVVLITRYSAKVKNEWSLTSALLCVSIQWYFFLQSQFNLKLGLCRLYLNLKLSANNELVLFMCLWTPSDKFVYASGALLFLQIGLIFFGLFPFLFFIHAYFSFLLPTLTSSYTSHCVGVYTCKFNCNIFIVAIHCHTHYTFNISFSDFISLFCLIFYT